MLDIITDGSLMPHGHCLLWRWDLLFLHVVGDFLTVLAYGLIPFAIVYFVYKRTDIKFNWLIVLFAGFIAFCGMTHLVGLINVWHGYYFIEGIVKFLTGIISITTAYMLWRLMPQLLTIPSLEMLQQRNVELERVKKELEDINKTLEEKVKLRTIELEIQANTDPVTGIESRHAIMEILENNFNHHTRYNRIFSVLMIDIDHFKQVNDNFGHQTGDKILYAVAQCIKQSCRLTDYVGRYGGEEFLVILPETDSIGAQYLAERIRTCVAELELSIAQRVTCSIGISSMQKGLIQATVIKNADEALYQAKRTGRNRVKVYTPSDE
ncbi:diguanylate cyclase [Catenovulum sp. 2E275]|uniref:GGDEF domain-containing protein n=1 Tax=Catenovulum sp. 2E275 TaxID=2980497 RepID=UPI0021CEA88D|nr:diguanylate cyclase [Catenovulum sp. 2E275]MCU4676691.1 diguanylate cyclase [Catenovulum sp. 2E275]